MKIHILTIFPDMFKDVFRHGVVGRAIERTLARVHIMDLRDFTQDVHRTVDDRPYGGGAGMVLKPEPICLAIDSLVGGDRSSPHVVLLSPQGHLFSQEDAFRWASLSELVLICGRYEGVDERIVQFVADEEVSVGDYVLSGGEFPAMLLVDAILRLLPGVLGNEESIEADSFTKGILGYPHYTRPPEYRGWKVPEVLLSGDHERIRRWREQSALEKTRKNRPGLLSEQAPIKPSVLAGD